ncbi:MAG: hypothetical protein ABJO09_20015 [Hyphomicrobiales bacterium]
MLRVGPFLLRLFLLLAVLSPAAIFGTANFVLYKASQTANGAPFCVQVATQSSVGQYKPVRSLWQLTILAMHTRYQSLGGSDSFQFAFHGVLVVDGKENANLWHWSWTQFGWQLITEGERQALRVEASCSPSRTFNEDLPIV